MQKQPIHEVIAKVLAEHGKPMSARDIYEAIRDGHLYDFKAKDPANIVRSQLRRHCLSVRSPKGTRMKYFEMTTDGAFRLLEKPALQDED
ncbi:MAG: HTH domain-containing protein [Pirellulaceae bacterium]